MTDQIPPYPGTPRWVKRSAVAVAVFIIVIALIVLFGIGGNHGPWRHVGEATAEPSKDAGP